LDILFQRSTIDKHTPFVRYQSRKGILYKLHKESMAPQGILSFERHIKKWIKADLPHALGGTSSSEYEYATQKTQKNSRFQAPTLSQDDENEAKQKDEGFITYRIYIGKFDELHGPKFITLRVQSDGTMDIIMNFSVHDIVNLSFIEKHIISQINFVIQRLYTDIKDIEIFEQGKTNLTRHFLPMLQSQNFLFFHNKIIQFTHDTSYRLQTQNKFEKKQKTKNKKQKTKNMVREISHFKTSKTLCKFFNLFSL